MRAHCSFVSVVVLWAIGFYFWEWSVYFIVLGQCKWPEVKTTNTQGNSNNSPVYAMFISDTHLLSTNGSSWIDMVRTNWQMLLAFQTALSLHRPEIVFVLGDLTDEGLFMTNDEFGQYTQRFYTVFRTTKDTVIRPIAGNHDIGFHYEVNRNRHDRFRKGFKSKDVELLTVRGNNFVLINSVLFEGNQSCRFCDEAKMELLNVARQLRCGDSRASCENELNSNDYSRPILLQHYPMFRDSDKDCHEIDEAPYYRKYMKFNETIDCQSKNTSDWLLQQLNPRLVFSGHTHDGCTTPLANGKGIEITISSFNWKHKHNPSYGLVAITPNGYGITRCLIPTQVGTSIRYTFNGLILVCALFCMFCVRRKRKRLLLLV